MLQTPFDFVPLFLKYGLALTKVSSMDDVISNLKALIPEINQPFCNDESTQPTIVQTMNISTHKGL